MTAKELKKKLIAAGWLFEEGSKHTQIYHPSNPSVRYSLHRHTKDIPKGTLEKLLRDTGLK